MPVGIHYERNIHALRFGRRGGGHLSMCEDFCLPDISHFIFHVRDGLENPGGNQICRHHPGQADQESDPFRFAHMPPVRLSCGNTRQIVGHGSSNFYRYQAANGRRLDRFFRAVWFDQHQPIDFRRIPVRAPIVMPLLNPSTSTSSVCPTNVWLIWSEMVC